MSKHTQGRLVVLNSFLVPVAHADRKIGGSSDPKRDHDEYAHYIADVKGKRDYHNSEANARRLAAAWNACEGMTTKAIEALAGIGSLGELKASELDSANALLREILDGFDKIADEMIAEGEVIEWEGLVAAQKIRNHLAGKAKEAIK